MVHVVLAAGTARVGAALLFASVASARRFRVRSFYLAARCRS